MNHGGLILAYHGCDVTLRDRLVRGTLRDISPSTNRYDWLGAGVYFFEEDAERALAFAKASRDKPSRLYTARPIVNPSVVGAVLSVSRCWDMTTQEGRRKYVDALSDLRAAQQALARPMPVNQSASEDDESMLLRRLDCAVFNAGHLTRARQGLPSHQAVRAAFYQGRPVAETSEFRTGTHLQIALRDPSCVLGWFLPTSIGPALSDEELSEADSAVAAAMRVRSANKPRLRSPS